MQPSTSKKTEVLIVAAEASSALYAQRLLEEWQAQDVAYHAYGVGNQSMEDLGFERIGKAEEMAVMGFQEVLAHYSEIKAVFWNIVQKAKEEKPKFALLMDYPDFNLRMAKELKALGIPVVYYISPQIWAWRKSRIHKIKKFVDQMLVLFPFELDFYKNHGMKVEFVGHPLLDELKLSKPSEEERKEARQRLGIFENELILGFMPGSRKSELKHHLNTQMLVAKQIHSEFPNLKLCMLVAPSLDADLIKQQIVQYDVPIRLISDDPIQMISVCDIVLCKSGTGSLLTGLLQKPMVIMYKMNALSALIARSFVDIDNFGMVNLISDKEVVPELFQEQASVENICHHLRNYITSPELRTQTSVNLLEVVKKLGDGGATQRVAKALREYF